MEKNYEKKNSFWFLKKYSPYLLNDDYNNYVVIKK